jgi:hypothetical protein
MTNNIPSNGPTLLSAWCLAWLVVESAWAKLGGSCTWIGIACMALLGHKEAERRDGTDRVHKVEWTVYIYGAESIMKRLE